MPRAAAATADFAGPAGAARRLLADASYGTFVVPMILLRCFVLLLWLTAANRLAAQGTATPPPVAAETTVFADERTARLAERYQTMLTANPAEGLALDRLWKLYEDAGATGKLIDLYRRADDPASALLYGHLLKKAGRLDDADAAYEHAAQLAPESPLPTLGRASLALARSRPSEAADLFEKAEGQLPPADPRRADVLLKTGDAWLLAGQPRKAAESWEKTVALAPADLAMHRRLAENYEKNGLPERAIGHYEFIAAHADPPGRAAALRELGYLHELRGEFDAARDALERGLALTARDNWLYGDLQTRLIRLYQRAGRTAELAARWQRAVEQAPRDLGGYQRLEALAESEGDVAGERAWLEKIAALAPRDRDSSLKLARLLADAGEHAPAAARYDALLQAQPGSPDLILARSEIDVQMGRPDQAAARVEARLAQSPADENVAAAALEFFLGHHLDAASERCLRAQTTRNPAATEPSLALARFLFAARRPDDARHVLGDLCAQPGDPAARAARWLAVADTYRELNFGDDALHGWQEAASLQPLSPVPLTASGDFLLARGDTTGALARLESALSLIPPGTEQVEAEHKLFQVLQQASALHPASPPPGTSPGPGEAVIGVPSAAPDQPVAAHAEDPLGQYLAGLQKMAGQEPTPEHFLRLARWQYWAGDFDGASGAAEKTVAIDPANVPARQLLVSIANDTHHHDAAEARLREIIALDPSQQTVCLRQIAVLKADDNDPEAALEIYDALQKAAPGSVAAATDFALAQQRADRWYDALATWEHVYALPALSPSQRADTRRALLAVYERLEQFPRAAEVLQATVDALPDLPEREEAFRELAAFCAKHDLGDGLEKEYRARLAARPNDFFLLTALATLTHDTGREREGYGLLERAFFSAPDPVGALHGLVDAARALGENGDALGYQRRLTALPGEATIENLGKLAELQTADLDDEAASRTWEQTVAKFPRDPNCLARGAEFFEGIGKTGRARELLQQAVALDANDPRRMLHLARLDLDAGDAPAARDLFEHLLDRTDPEKPGDAFSPPPELQFASGPLPGLIFGSIRRRARASGFTSTSAPAPESDEHHLRLDAIRELARLLVSGGSDADRKRWLARWTAAAAAGLRNEPLAAFFFSGQNAATMDLLAHALKARPDDEQARNAFLAAGLRLGAYRDIAKWAWQGNEITRQPENAAWLLAANQQFFDNGGKPGPGMVAELFPSGVKLRDTFWETATTAFAAHSWFAQAAELGTRACLLSASNRSPYALKIAEWEVYGGRIDRAKEILRDAVETDHGDSLEASGNSVFAALRDYYLLLPEGERAAFAEGYLQRMRDRGEYAQATLAAVLLHGFGGAVRAAERDLDDLLAMRMLSTIMAGGTPDARRWTFILNNGDQLKTWGLEPLAAHYWRRALLEISPFDRQDAVALNCQSEIRGRLLAVEIALAAGPPQAQERVMAYLRTGPAADAVATTAAQLMSESRYPEAARLYEFLCRARDVNPEMWRALCVCYESAGDPAALERTLTARLADPALTVPGLPFYSVIVQLARLRETEGDLTGACRLLEHSLEVRARVQPVLLELAAMEERAGRRDAAAQTWEDVAPANADGPACLAKAEAWGRLGRIDQAADLLGECLHTAREPVRTNAAVQIGHLFISAKRAAEVRTLANGLLQDGPTAALPPVAMELAAAGEQAFARDLLIAAVRRTADPQGRYEAQQQVVALSAKPDGDLAVFVREMRRLEGFARTDTALRARFEQDRYRFAHQRGADEWLEGELRREWANGRGDTEAGQQLVSLYLGTGRNDRLGEVIDAINHHPDLPEQMLRTLASQLVQSQQGPVALPMLERLHRRFPQNEAYAEDQARALWQAGRHDEAGALLEGIEAQSVFRDDLVGHAADIYLGLGAMPSARRLLEPVARRDGPVVRYPQIDLQLARMETEAHRPAEARRWLQAAYRNPTCVDFAPLLDYLSATGRLDGEAASRAMPGGDIALSFPRRARLLAAIFDRLTAAGKNDGARRWVEAHPELLAGAPELVTATGRILLPGDLPTFTAQVESVAEQVDPPVPRLSRELAALHLQCAAQESADPARQLGDLARAHELTPDDFDVAQQLAVTCLKQQLPDRAAEALAAFLGPDALPDERTRARQILGGAAPATAGGGPAAP